MLVLRVWLEPPLRLHEGRIDVPGLGEVVVERVEPLMGEDKERSVFTLASVTVVGEDVAADLSKKWQRLDEAVHLLAFAEMALSKVIAARVEMHGVPIGTPCPVRLYPTIPTSSSIFLPGGFAQSPRRCMEVPVLKQELRVALG